MKMNTQPPKPMGHSEDSPRGKVRALQTYPKKIEKSQINNLTLHLKELEEQQQKSPEQAEKRKYSRSEKN